MDRLSAIEEKLVPIEEKPETHINCMVQVPENTRLANGKMDKLEHRIDRLELLLFRTRANDFSILDTNIKQLLPLLRNQDGTTCTKIEEPESKTSPTKSNEYEVEIGEEQSPRTCPCNFDIFSEAGDQPTCPEEVCHDNIVDECATWNPGQTEFVKSGSLSERQLQHDAALIIQCHFRNHYRSRLGCEAVVLGSSPACGAQCGDPMPGSLVGAVPSQRHQVKDGGTSSSNSVEASSPSEYCVTSSADADRYRSLFEKPVEDILKATQANFPRIYKDMLASEEFGGGASHGMLAADRRSQAMKCV